MQTRPVLAQNWSKCPHYSVDVFIVVVFVCLVFWFFVVVVVLVYSCPFFFSFSFLFFLFFFFFFFYRALKNGNKHGLCDCGLVQGLLVLRLFLQLSLPSFLLLLLSSSFFLFFFLLTCSLVSFVNFGVCWFVGL